MGSDLLLHRPADFTVLVGLVFDLFPKPVIEGFVVLVVGAVEVVLGVVVHAVDLLGVEHPNQQVVIAQSILDRCH